MELEVEVCTTLPCLDLLPSERFNHLCTKVIHCLHLGCLQRQFAHFGTLEDRKRGDTQRLLGTVLCVNNVLVERSSQM